jgi:hypothetical protein
MSSLSPVAHAPVSGPAVSELGLLDDDWDMPLLATQYAELTRDFLGVPAEIAFSLNDTAAASIAVMMGRRGMVPPPNFAFYPHADEIAEITLYNAACEVLARISFDTRGASSMDEIEAWLDRVRSGDRLLDFGVDVLRHPAVTGEMARGVAGRLWDVFAG